MYGKRMTVNEVLDEVEKDSSFYRSTGGGITVSGGECLLQPDFSGRAARRRPPARHQHRDRDGLQRALGQRGKGTAPRRYDAP